MINSYYFDPSDKIKMYSWSPFLTQPIFIKPSLAELKLQGSTECQINHKPKGQSNFNLKMRTINWQPLLWD